MSVPVAVEFNTLKRFNKSDLASIAVRINEIIAGYHRRLNSLRDLTSREKIDRAGMEEVV